MKKLFITSLIVLTGSVAYTLPVANPADASLLCDGIFLEGHCGDPCDPYLTWCDAVSARIGFYGDYVYNRHLQIDDHYNKADLETTKIFTNAAFGAVNLWDRFELFGTLGTSRFFIDTNAKTFNSSALANGTRLVIETSTDFSWSAGVRGTIWECGCTTLGAEGQFFSARPHVSRATEASTISLYPDNITARYWEWQIGVGVSHRINKLVPYVAVKWAQARMNLDEALFPLGTFGTSVLQNLRSQKLWGFALGLSFVDCEKASVTVEGRWGDETGFHLNGQLRF